MNDVALQRVFFRILKKVSGSWRGVSQTKRPVHAPQKIQNPPLKATAIHPELKNKRKDWGGTLN